MTTTLRLDDALYREAKAAAAREGVTITRFIEEGLKLRLASPALQPQGEVVLHTFNSGKTFDVSPEDIKKRLADVDAVLDARALSNG